MTPEPLDALRLPIVPVEPRPEFADALLRRIGAARAGRAPATEPLGPAAPQAATVRYFVDDLDTAISFYCRRLGFREELRSPGAFAMLYRGSLRLLLSVPGAPGAGHALPDGTVPAPGGWNRIALQVTDLAAAVAVLRDAGARFRDDMVSGVGVRQVVLLDPSGNLVELFEPAAGYHERPRPRTPGGKP
jgi:catechol 2,3-dioxygenase-like lactoylglutathione lyase family enzyme